MSRILLVSNRLPITVTAANGQGVVTRSAGGLAGALSSVHEQADSLWIGWPGGLPALPPQAVRQLAWQMAAMRFVPVQPYGAVPMRPSDGRPRAGRVAAR